MNKHTPGPWGFDGSHIYAPDGGIIAQVHNPGRTASDYPLEANRNLMAAAPELLEALVGCVEHMEWSTDQGQSACLTALAAIAKATGAA